MASVYNLEPPPTAKCILHTTSGPITMELFAKQTALASRSFLQHLLDGYYTSTTFHRLVSGFIIQGGDPTGTGQGGESAFPSGAVFKGGKDGRTEEIFDEGGCFRGEYHSRLKFNRRGLLGMSSTENGGQFFFTLGPTPELQGKNTLFGRVEGETIYNLMKMGEAELEEVEGSERPMYPTRITGAEVLVNPFEDMTIRDLGPKVATVQEKQFRKGQKKGKKNKTLLSFGVEEGEEDGVVPVLKKEKFNPKLVSAGEGFGIKGQVKEVNDSSKSVQKKSEKVSRRRSTRSPSPHRPKRPNEELQLPLPRAEEASRSPSPSLDPAPVQSMTSTLDRTNAQIAELKASMKRNIQRGPEVETKKKSALEQMIPKTAVRGRKRKHGGKDEDATMDFLNAFRTKLEKAAPEANLSEPSGDLLTDGKQNETANGEVSGREEVVNNNGDEAELCDLHFIANCQSCKSWNKNGGESADHKDEDGEGWMSHTLSFEKDRLGKDLNWKRKNEEELVVIDPREKAKDLREEARAKKLARMGKTGPGPEWSREREPRKAA